MRETLTIFEYELYGCNENGSELIGKFTNMDDAMRKAKQSKYWAYRLYGKTSYPEERSVYFGNFSNIF